MWVKDIADLSSGAVIDRLVVSWTLMFNSHWGPCHGHGHRGVDVLTPSKDPTSVAIASRAIQRGSWPIVLTFEVDLRGAFGELPTTRGDLRCRRRRPAHGVDRIASSYERVARFSKVSPPTDTPFEPMRSASRVRSSEAFSAARTRWFE